MLLHTATGVRDVDNFGVGLTVIVKVLVDPEHPVPFVYKGVTTIVAITGAVVILAAANEAISTLPDAARPIEDAELVQEYVVAPPVLTVAKLIAAVLFVLQST